MKRSGRKAPSEALVIDMDWRAEPGTEQDDEQGMTQAKVAAILEDVLKLEDKVTLRRSERRLK